MTGTLSKGVKILYNFTFLMTLVSLPLYWNTITGAISSIPRPIQLAIVTVLVAWTGADMFLEKLPSQPLGLLFLGLIGTVLLTHAWVKTQQLPSIGPIDAVIALPGGIVVWMLSVLMFGMITVSMFNIDITKRKFENIDDPYGDKHAARILNNDEDTS